MLPDTVTPGCEENTRKMSFWMKWNRTSPELQMQSESKLLNRLKSRLHAGFVSIFGGKSYIRTLVARGFSSGAAAEKRIPIVLMHGFASGLGLWCKNIDSLAAYRPVYAFDLLGFGRSSRPDFPTDSTEAEVLFVDSFEEWRAAMGLSKFILVGHSLGGYISTSYAIRHPEKIAHLILVDPWGFLEIPLSEELKAKHNNSPWLLRAYRNLLSGGNPLTILRAIGPLGRSLIHRVRQDLRVMFDQRSLISGEFIEIPSVEVEESAQQGYLARHLIDSDTNDDDGYCCYHPLNGDGASSNTTVDVSDFDGTAALDYIYHMNVQRPSGETGFKALCTMIGWAERPMLDRIHLLDRNVPITFIFGSRSWLDMSSGTKTRARRPDSYVDIKIIDGAGHQVYAHAAEEFNQYVNTVGKRVDAGDLFRPSDYQNTPNDTDSLIRTNENRLSKRRSVGSSNYLAQAALLPDEHNPSTSENILDEEVETNDVPE
ncbi:unnamed protein product [Dicrocoelium dendriticum]|nr:unnamed protein product [Dicrocoelium dendriticum]